MTEEKVVTEANGAETKKETKPADEVTKPGDEVDEKTKPVSEEMKPVDEEKKPIDDELQSAIIRQVEYYFGDANLLRDKFLREQVKLDEGWVPLEVLVRFNRLAQISKDYDVIANALSKSTTGLLEISDDNRKVRRNPELPVPEMNEEKRKELQGRTVYAKGFPKDSELDPLLKFFNSFGEVENLIMRRYQEKATKKRIFKGSVFCMFKTNETAEKFLSTSPVKYGETELVVHWQHEYLTKKQEEYAEKKEKQDKKKVVKVPKADVPKEEFKLPTGTVLLVSGTTDSTKREDIKEALAAFGAETAYVDFKVGDTVGWVRLTKENAAKEIIDKIPDGKLKIGGKETTVKLLEGEEEKTYLDKTVEEMAKRRKNQKTFGKFNNKNKNQRGRFGKKRKQDQHDDAPPTKVRVDDS